MRTLCFDRIKLLGLLGTRFAIGYRHVHVEYPYTEEEK